MKAYLFSDQDGVGVEIITPLEMSMVLQGKMVAMSEPNGDFVVLVGNHYKRHSALIADYLKQLHGITVERYLQNFQEEATMKQRLKELGLKSEGGMNIDFSPAYNNKLNIETTRITGRSVLLGSVKLEVLEQIVPHIFEDPGLALSWERRRAQQD
jgi:hypothetical protein